MNGVSISFLIKVMVRTMIRDPRGDDRWSDGAVDSAIWRWRLGYTNAAEHASDSWWATSLSYTSPICYSATLLRYLRMIPGESVRTVSLPTGRLRDRLSLTGRRAMGCTARVSILVSSIIPPKTSLATPLFSFPFAIGQTHTPPCFFFTSHCFTSLSHHRCTIITAG